MATAPAHVRAEEEVANTSWRRVAFCKETRGEATREARQKRRLENILSYLVSFVSQEDKNKIEDAAGLSISPKYEGDDVNQKNAKEAAKYIFENIEAALLAWDRVLGNQLQGEDNKNIAKFVKASYYKNASTWDIYREDIATFALGTVIGPVSFAPVASAILISSATHSLSAGVSGLLIGLGAIASIGLVGLVVGGIVGLFAYAGCRAYHAYQDQKPDEHIKEVTNSNFHSFFKPAVDKTLDKAFNNENEDASDDEREPLLPSSGGLSLNNAG